MFDFLNLLKLVWMTGSYSTQAFKMPLSKEEEEKYIDLLMQGDKNARNILIERNLRLVAHIVKKFDSLKYLQDDLIGIGTVGLIKAVDSYKKSKNIRLTTYAAKCIQNEILMYLRKSSKWMHDVSLSEKVGYDKDGNEVYLGDVIKGEDEDSANLEYKKENIEALKKYLNVLSKRERYIIDERYGLNNTKPKTQKEISKSMNISRSYVSRLEKRALSKMLKEFIKNKKI